MNRRPGLDHAFRNNPELSRFVLEDVTPTGRVLGTGSYGSVEEVSYKHTLCAGKKLHSTLLDIENEGVSEVARRYLQESELMSSLRHPNICQFFGICFVRGSQLPLLVMEKLETSLDYLLENMTNLPLSLKCSMLENVACGLLYLHSRHPPVIHRDLTSKNVLLTSSLVAKITDMGNSRIVSMSPGQMARTLTKYPGTLVYMAPETQDDTHRYGTSIDVFSFGHLALFTLTQKFPGDLLSSTYIAENEVRGRSEVDRRWKYVEEMMQMIANCPALIELVLRCLHNDPRARPSTEELLTTLGRIKTEVEGYSGGSAERLGVMLAKEMRDQNDRRRVEVEREMQATHKAELEDMRRNMEKTTRQLEYLRLSSEESLTSQPNSGPTSGHFTGPISGPITGPISGFNSGPNSEILSIIGDLVVFQTNLGNGAFASVHRAQYQNKACAAKMLLQHARDMLVGATDGRIQNAAKEAFTMECGRLQKLQHENVVQYIATAFEPKSQLPILVMELMECSLRKFISDHKPLPCNLQLTICFSVSSGLDYLHYNNIIHRDLCDDNVLLKHSPKLIVKITDFGMSRILDYDSMSTTMTAVGHRKGYLPPEGEDMDDDDDDEENYDKARYSQRLDIYSFGAVATQTVQSADHFKTRKKMERTFREISPDHPIKEIIGKCIDTDSKQRPPAQTVCKDIARVIASDY